MPSEDPLATFRVPSVSADAMRTLAVMFRDGNPIHLYPEAAAEYGLGDRVVNPWDPLESTCRHASLSIL